MLQNWEKKPEVILENRRARKLIKTLESKSCKKLIAISNNARQIQLAFLKQIKDCVDVEEVIDKTTVIHPPQFLLSSSPRCYSSDFPLRVCFVGHQFFLKGGREVISACEKINKLSGNVHLTLISSLRTDNFASYTTKADQDLIKNKISQTPWITHYN